MQGNNSGHARTRHLPVFQSCVSAHTCSERIDLLRIHILTHPVLLCLLDDLGEVHDAPLRVRVLEQHARDVLTREVRLEDVRDLDVDAEGQSASRHAADGLRMQLVRENETLPLVGPESTNKQ